MQLVGSVSSLPKPNEELVEAINLLNGLGPLRTWDSNLTEAVHQ